MALTVEHIHRMLEPGAEALGYELLAVEMAGSEQSLLRVYIDSAAGITVDDCAAASEQFSAILDVENPISGSYRLEVSSPGWDRPLNRPEHFRAALGETVRIRTRDLIEGRRRFKGELALVDDDAVMLIVDGAEYRLAYADMERARLAPAAD